MIALGQVGHGLFEDAHVATAGRDVAIAELVMQDDILFGPEHDDRLVAPRSVVGHGGRVLVALHERRVYIEGCRRLPGPALEAGHQGPIGGTQASQGRGLQWDRGLRARCPQRPVLHVERLEEVADGGGRWQGVARAAWPRPDPRGAW